MTLYRKLQYVAIVAIAVAGIGVGASPAQAAFTTVNGPAGGEDGHQEILENVFGGSFTPSGADFINGGGSGTVNATRIDDDDDQVWNMDVPTSAFAEAVFAVFNQSFGYLPEASGPLGDYVELFATSGNGYAVTGQAVDVDLTADDFRWARSGTQGVFSSLETDNDSDNDHMVTYQITGTGSSQPVFMLFFEDGFKDFDYQDLVVKITAVPSPAAIGPGLALLGLVGLTRRRRNRA